MRVFIKAEAVVVAEDTPVLTTTRAIAAEFGEAIAELIFTLRVQHASAVTADAMTAHLPTSW